MSNSALGRAMVLAAAALAAATGCATKPAPRPAVKPGLEVTVQRSVRLAWLPVEGYWLPDLAQALNAKLEQAAVPGIDFRTKAPVSMEVAQLSLECIAASPTCWSRVGTSLEANRLLWADLTRPRDDEGEAVRASIVVFDVDNGAVLSRQDSVFANPAQALAGIDGLVKLALDGVDGAPVAAQRDGREP